MSQKETFLVPVHTSNPMLVRELHQSYLIDYTSSYTDASSGNIWINNSDGSLNFAYISGSQTSI